MCCVYVCVYVGCLSICVCWLSLFGSLYVYVSVGCLCLVVYMCLLVVW